jgi:ribose transport system substrate-binding protein
MRNTLSWIAGIAGAIVLAGGAAAQQAPKRDATIGIVTLQMRAPYFVAMVRALEAEGAKRGIKTVVADGGGDAAKVSSDIEDLLARGVDGLIMNISPLESLPGPMAAIKKAGKPVVLVNRKLTGGEYDAWVGVDNRVIGTGVGEVIAKHMSGKGVLMMMRGGPEDNSTGNARRDGVLSKVKDTGVEVLTAPEFGKWTEDGGMRVMEDMLAKHKQINVVFCENDSMCLGAQKAIADAKRTGDISIFGFDGQKSAIDQIAKGTNYLGSGQNSPSVIARIGFERMAALLAGQKVEKDTITPVVVITKENAASLLDPASPF